MAKVIRPFSHIKVKTLANRVRPATVLTVNSNEFSARIGSATNGTTITVIADPERPRKFIEGAASYPATVSTYQEYEFPEIHWNGWGELSAAAGVARYVAYRSQSGVSGFFCGSANFAPFSLQSNDNYNQDFFCAAGGPLVTKTIYTCPNGGIANPDGMCVDSYPAVQGVQSYYYDYRKFTVSEYGSYAIAQSTANEKCLPPIYGGWDGESFVDGRNCKIETIGLTCPTGGTLNTVTGMCE